MNQVYLDFRGVEGLKGTLGHQVSRVQRETQDPQELDCLDQLEPKDSVESQELQEYQENQENQVVMVRLDNRAHQVKKVNQGVVCQDLKVHRVLQGSPVSKVRRETLDFLVFLVEMVLLAHKALRVLKVILVPLVLLDSWEPLVHLAKGPQELLDHKDCLETKVHWAEKVKREIKASQALRVWTCRDPRERKEYQGFQGYRAPKACLVLQV